MISAAKDWARSYMSRPRALPPERRQVLLYHSVHPQVAFRSVTPNAFHNHLDWLIDNCEVVPLHSIVNSGESEPGQRPQIAITFDDGFEDNYRYAFPALAARYLPATFFVTTGLIEGSDDVRSRFARLHGVSISDVVGMTWSQLSEMRDEGMTISAHTVTHPNLAICDPAIRSRELADSKLAIEQRLQDPVTSVAYPFGKPKHNVTSDVIDAAIRTGYDIGCTVTYLPLRPRQGRFWVPRYPVIGDDVDTLASMVAGGWDILGRWQRLAPRWLSAAVSPERTFGDEQSMLSSG